jgi:hypothetical protein
VLDIGRYIRKDEGPDIKSQIIIILQTQHSHIVHFHDPPEKIQGQHIKEQMHIIGMDEPAGNKPVILMFLRNGRRPENEIINNSSISESGNGNNGRYEYNTQCDGKHAG